MFSRTVDTKKIKIYTKLKTAFKQIFKYMFYSKDVECAFTDREHFFLQFIDMDKIIMI